MSADVKALRTLVALRRRAGERLAASLAQARAQLADCEDAVAAAQDEHARCVADEQQGQSDLADMMCRAFTPDSMRVLGFRIDDLKSAAMRAQRKVAEQRVAHERQAQVVVAARQAISVNDQRLAGVQERLGHLLRQREQAGQEREEDESNETATTRFLARRREARERADG
jgi:hypothetical protein